MIGGGKDIKPNIKHIQKKYQSCYTDAAIEIKRI
jgi:hypothetical protein